MPDQRASTEVVADIAPEETHDLRLRALRSHLPDPELEYPSDRLAGTFHLGVRVGDEVVAVASFALEPAPGRPGVPASRLRGMAVDPAHERRGLGRAILHQARRRLRADGVELLWANARVSALPFYRAQGFVEQGDEFESLGLPHRVVVLDLAD